MIEILLEKLKNIILIVKTGFDKSIIFQAASLMFALTKIAMIIMLLKVLKEKQCEKLQRIAGSISFILDSDSNRTANL